MICPACNTANAPDAEECFVCGKALFALTQGSVLAQRYEILRLVGHGGMGRVYEAHDRMLEERVAIKVLRPQFAREPEMARRFLLEVRLARRITHPERLPAARVRRERRHPLPLHGAGRRRQPEGRAARRAGSRRTQDATTCRRPRPRASRRCTPRDVIHRDFKTANIMVDGRGQAKVMDFGIAKELGCETTGSQPGRPRAGHARVHEPGARPGRPPRLPQRHLRARLRRLRGLHGPDDLPGQSPIDTLRRHLHQPATFSSDRGLLVPEPLVPVLTRALAKKPDDRYATVTELAEALRAARSASVLHVVLGDEAPLAALLEATPTPTPVSLTPVPVPVRPGPTRALKPGERPSGPRPTPAALRRVRWPVGVAGVAVLVAIVAFAWSRGTTPLPGELPPPAVASAPPPTVITLAPPLPSPSLAPPPTSTRAPAPTPVPRDERPRASARATAPPSPPPTTLAERAAVIAAAPAPTLPTQIPPPVSTLSEEFGVIKLLVLPPSQVTIDGDVLGIVSAREVRLSAGAHAVTVENPGYLPYKRRVDVSAGTATELFIDLSEKGVPRTR